MRGQAVGLGDAGNAGRGPRSILGAGGFFGGNASAFRFDPPSDIVRAPNNVGLGLGTHTQHSTLQKLHE